MRGRLAARQQSFTPSSDGNDGDRHTFSTANPGSVNPESANPRSTSERRDYLAKALQSLNLSLYLAYRR
ncbi:MAG: hypothetical protein WBA57_26945 [Elainellaceae cyanobacterium]